MSESTHMEMIDGALSGRAIEKDQAVVDSWRRCVEHHGLDPLVPNSANIIPAERLREHRQSTARLTHMSRGILQTLFRHVAKQDYALLLADKFGIIVDHFGDPAFEAELLQSGLTLGANWSEACMGTSGVGAVLETGRPLTIHQTDHFNVAHASLSCSASPIYDPTGQLLAVLDLSLLRAPQSKISQQLILKLVRASTRRIEVSNLAATTRGDWVLRFSALPEMIDLDPDAALAIDGSGRIVGMTHNAAQLLAQTANVDWQDRTNILNQPLQDFFDLDLDALETLSRTRPTQERTIRLKCGTVLFGQATEQQNDTRKPRKSPSLIAQALGAGDMRIETLAAKAERLAPTNLSVLLRGETGTGKERLARAIHQTSRKDCPFIVINGAALPSADLDSELFGKYGTDGHDGILSRASGGTLFLDEVGDMPLDAQARLLRALSEMQGRPTCGGASLSFKFRVISSTQRDLQAQVAQGTFRKDLLYRLAGATLDIPPLRQRQDDVAVAKRILRQITIADRDGWQFTPSACSEIARRHWAGNLRELRNAIECAVALADSPVIGASDFPAPLILEPSEEAAADSLLEILEASEWNLADAARTLGVDRSTIHRRMQRQGITRPRG